MIQLYMTRFFLSLFFFLIGASTAMAQFYPTQYRSPGQNWMEIKTEKFRVIYPERYRAEAFRTMRILETEYDDIRELVGGDLKNFPFIINPENDRSNGFVSPLNFRSEIELAPIKSKSMNPASGDWLETVVPHELVHALHFSVNPTSLTRAIGLFSPDIRRSVHSAAPLGVFEGIAVQHESHGTIPYSGRGNHSYFTNQFTTLLDTPDELSMGQLFQTSDFTPPFDRHYIGGYKFTNWMLNTYGENAMKDAIQFHYRYPFLGFGTALRHVTGKWPGPLYSQFQEYVEMDEDLRLNKFSENTDQKSHEITFNASCARMSRPLWVDDEQIVFYGRACNKPSGFYIHNTTNGDTSLLEEVSIVRDHHYSLSTDNSHLYYSRYHTNLLYDNLFSGDLHRLDIDTGNSQKLTRNQRLFAPNSSANQIYALQTDAHELNLVRLNQETGLLEKTFERPEESSVVQVAVRPNSDNEAAILGKRKSVQAIWFQNLQDSERVINGEPDIVFSDGSVFDLHWHPSGEKLLFVSDRTGTMNIYEFYLSENSINQITESLYNAFEPSYSPDGKTISYIRQVKNEQRLFTLNRSDALDKPVPQSEWTYNNRIRDQLTRPLMNRTVEIEGSEWEPTKYRTGLSWLKPRLWVPLYERESDFDRIGLTLESTNTLSTQAYSLDVNHYLDRIWFNLNYINKTFYPGFVLDVFSEPTLSPFTVEIDDRQVTTQLLQQSVGGSLKIPFRFRFESNARFTSFLIEPQYFLSNIRFLNPANTGQAFSEFGTRHTVGLRSVLNLNLRQFTRDVQPNSGWSFFSEARYGLNSDEFEIVTEIFGIEGNLAKRKGFRGGVTRYLSPLSRWNQSLRVTAQAITQTDLPVFGLSSLFSNNFSETPVPSFNNVGLLNTRYTIPIVYPDDGGLLLPAYLSNIYLVLFSQTAVDLNNPDLINGSRSVFGGGIRSRFRISNLAFDVGISFGWEPMRNDFTFHFGSF